MGVDTSALSMTYRDVIISYRDISENTTYYLQVNPADNTTVKATEVSVYCYCMVAVFIVNFPPTEHAKCDDFSNGNKPGHDNEPVSTGQV